MAEEKKNIPKLRFREFTGDNANAWELRKLKKIIKRVRGNDGRMTLPTLTISAANGWMDQVTRFSSNIAGKEQKNYTLLKKGQLSYNHGNSKLAKYGAVFELREYEEALVPRVYHSFEVSDGSPAFIEYMFLTKLPDRELRKLVSSGARMDGLLNINYDDFSNINIKTPTVAEEVQIAYFLRKLDKLITLHQRMLDEYKTLKKTMLSKMFPKNSEKYPELRFSGFTDAWELRKLGLLASFTKGNGYSKKDLVQDSNQTPIILYGSLYTNYKTNIEKVDTFARVKDKTIYSSGNDVVVPASGESAEDISRASAILKKGIILGGDLNIIHPLPDLNAIFLAITISNGTQKRELSRRAQGKSVVHLRNQDLKQVNLLYPNLEEQQKIGSFFKHLDSLITLHQRELELLKTLKKTMLQQMFV